MSSSGKPSRAREALEERREARRAARADAATRPASRLGGCLITLFGLPFLCGGLFAWSTLVLVPMDIMPMEDRPESTWGWVGFGVMLFLFGAVFAAVGGGIVWAGVMVALGKGALPSKRPGGTRALKAKDLTDWRADAAFRKAPGAGQPAGARAALRPAIGRWWKLLGMVALALFWNGLCGFAFYHLWGEAGRDKGAMVGLVFVAIFLLVGLLIIWGAVHQFLTIVLVGKTWVEAMPAMPAPGERLQLWLHQKGDLQINKAELAIECVEVYSYGAGSSRVTKRDVIYEQVLASRESFRSDGSRPLLEGELRLPADAMHSFHASSNQVVWQVKATLDIAGRPDVEDQFPIAVRPEVVAG